jgi:predicted dehydrogenase
MNRVRVGIVGYGYWGPNIVRNFDEIPASDVVAIADVKDEQLKRAQSRYPHVTLTKDYCDLFKLDLDAVVVATPPATHYAIAKECLDQGLHVLVEKPLTLNSQHAQELIEHAAAKGLTLMVGHTFEYNTAVHALKEYMENGELGDIYYLDTARLNLGLFQRETNVLWDLAPHDISILLYLIGQPPISVSAQGMSCVFEGIPDVAYLHLIFPNRKQAYVHVSWLDPCKVRRVTIVGSKKMIVYNDIENEQKIKIYDKGVETPAYTNSFADFQCSYHYGDITIPRIRYAEPLKEECQEFLCCIQNNKEPMSCGRDGLRVVKILEAAQRSMNNGSTQEVIQW